MRGNGIRGEKFEGNKWMIFVKGINFSKVENI